MSEQDKDFFQFRRLYELMPGQVFKIRSNGIFYLVRTSDEFGVSYQTLFGKIKNYYKQHYNNPKITDIEILFYPNRHI